ncbi:low specificity L-threonine aldolase [Sedimentitalea sp. CY04]|uniref:Low specificity L-threonine aldolase n=1 Tax=Parasedimentitalea denitrificans TaxID=2211118 RepID=A0ABX0W1R6_9RHOB|nr:GntG family PLP-dependent aldolase [Sedimentitalea sp. CY04]NIZ59407.1 low specificity L-threonine aldolase [Sedimentitalea sp. CY04]
MPRFPIDLISDTSTRPSAGMLQAMASAETGDEQRGEDPTTLALCERMADMLGMEAAIFLPSGTMCNQISFLVHCRPGDEILAAENAHIVRSEGAGASALAGAQIRGIPTPSGIFTADDAAAHLNRKRDRAPVSRLISVEQTSNSGGGAIWPLKTLQKLVTLKKERDLILHMDGARLFNATTASGIAPTDMCQGFDSVWVDLSKGLGCPVGAVLAGSKDFIARAWVWKHRLGGAMRQSGVIAAAGLYALDHNIDRLSQDHKYAHLLARLLVEAPGVRVYPEVPETNILFLDITDSGQDTAQMAEALATHGVRLNAEGKTLFRAVTHLDLSEAQIQQAAKAIIAALTP